MPFTPFHRFVKRKELEALLEDFWDKTDIPDEIYDNFQRYYPAFVHKLRSAKYNIERLEEKLTTTSIQDAANTIDDFMFEVNMYIDGFFYNSGSALDILARVILTLFGENLPDNVYFHSAHQILSASRASDPILPRIETPTWRASFSDYRNTLTHELILASIINMQIDTSGTNPITNIVLPLPDDPRARPSARKYNNHPDVLNYIKTHFTRILSIANVIFGDIIQRAKTLGSLPL